MKTGKLMLLTVFLIIIRSVKFHVYPQQHDILFQSPICGAKESKQEIRILRIMTEAEVIKAASYANTVTTCN